uniref:VWFD domain-containing protein n=1 Tax=Micrurus corallinus TaxID=54390 RepID=A0A2D4EQC8_MICCO
MYFSCILIRIQLPYNGPGFEIENFFNYIKVDSKIGLTLKWNKEDSLMLELDKKYANSTCGLCGDFNGISKYKEFYFENTPITNFQFGNQWKVNDPIEDCQDPIPLPQKSCTDEYVRMFFLVLLLCICLICKRILESYI